MGRWLCQFPARRVQALVAAFWLLACRASEPARGSEDSALQGEPAPVNEPAACGQLGLAECPTQRWMKATLQAYLRTADYERLEASFNELAKHAPAGYERWQDMA